MSLRATPQPNPFIPPWPPRPRGKRPIPEILEAPTDDVLDVLDAIESGNAPSIAAPDPTEDTATVEAGQDTPEVDGTETTEETAAPAGEPVAESDSAHGEPTEATEDAPVTEAPESDGGETSVDPTESNETTDETDVVNDETEDDEIPAPRAPIEEILEWVGDDLDRAAVALERENASSRKRQSLIDALTELLA